ncbi:MAG: FAD:protein FMN transferase [Elusimicrobiota bacterium]
MQYPAKYIRHTARKFAALLFLVFLSSVLSMTGCSEREPYRETRLLFDTYCEITIPGNENNAGQAADKAFKKMAEIETKFNVHDKKSILYRFNHERINVNDNEIIDVMKKALKIGSESSGAFDPTVYRLSELWGFYGDSPGMPDEKSIIEILKITDSRKIAVEDGILKTAEPGVMIDLGGIVKGYAVDEAVRVIRQAGFNNALVNAGGDLYAMGKISKKPWRVGIKDPSRDSIMGIIEVSDTAVVTSGDYERFFIKNGIRYHHILDPGTGYPAKGVQSVTVLCPEAADADAWATAVFVLGADKGMKAIDGKKGFEAIIIDSDGNIVTSNGLRERIKWINR